MRTARAPPANAHPPGRQRQLLLLGGVPAPTPHVPGKEMWAFSQLPVRCPARPLGGPGPAPATPARGLRPPAPRPRSPSGSSTVRARRSERVRRLSCSIALSILGAPPALPGPRRPPPRSAPYIPPRPDPRPETPARRRHARGGTVRSSPRPPPGSRALPNRSRRGHPPHRGWRPSCRRHRFPPGLARPSGNCSSESAELRPLGGATLWARLDPRSGHAEAWVGRSVRKALPHQGEPPISWSDFLDSSPPTSLVF